MQEVKPLETSIEQDIRNSVMAFLEGEQSFQWITEALTNSSLPKPATQSAVAPLRNYGDPFRAEALFAWLAQVEW